MRKGNATAAVVIPPKFGEDAGAAFFGPNPKPEIALLYDPSHSAERAMVEGMLIGDVMQAVSKEMFGGATGRQMVNDSLAQIEQSRGLSADNKKTLTDLLHSVQRLNEKADAGPTAPVGSLEGGLKVPFTAREEAVTSGANIQYNGYAHAFAGMVVQFILFLGIDVGVGLLQQRQRGLWKRFRAAPRRFLAAFCWAAARSARRFLPFSWCSSTSSLRGRYLVFACKAAWLASSVSALRSL